jgi:predicted phosphate transport protein (TIGR00153 family)
MKKSMEAYVKNDNNEKEQHIGLTKNAEHEGDEIKKIIVDELSKGMFLPPDREDLLLLNENLNDIADGAKGVVRLLELLENEPYGELDNLLLENCSIAVRAGEKLKEAINSLVKTDVQKVMVECAQIEMLEKEGDDKRRDLIKALIKTEITPQLTILVYEMIDNLENVIDCIKKAGDMVRILAIKAR